MIGEIVFVIKIGEVIRTFKKNTILIDDSEDHIIKYYCEKLRVNLKDEFEFIRTSIIRQDHILYDFKTKKASNKYIEGVVDRDPEIGEWFTLDNKKWSTSKVFQIIDEDIIVTSNSVYAIHNISRFRAKKINSLGL